MAYEKHTWETNEVITASKMNNIEEGIAENEGKITVLETSIGENSTTIGSINSNISDVNNRLVSVENTYVNEQVFLASLDAVRDMTVSILPNQGLSSEEKEIARNNIGASDTTTANNGLYAAKAVAMAYDGAVIPPCDDSQLSWTLVENKAGMLLMLNGANGSSNNRLCIYGVADKHNASPTYSAKPAWYNAPLSAFVIGHTYKFEAVLLSGTVTKTGVGNVLYYTLRTAAGTEALCGVGDVWEGGETESQNSVWQCTFVPEMVCFSIRNRTFDHAVIWLKITDLTVARAAAPLAGEVDTLDTRLETAEADLTAHDDRLTALETDVTAAQDDISGIMTRLDDYGLPDYWLAHITTKAAAINMLAPGGIGTGPRFSFVTDAHVRTVNGDMLNQMQSPKLLAALRDKANLPLMFFGGDAINSSYSTRDVAFAELAYFRERFSPVWDKLYCVFGNHDYGKNSASWSTETADIRRMYNLLIADKERHLASVNTSIGHYVLDDAAQKTRFLCLNENEAGNYYAQAAWIAARLLETPENWVIVVITHRSLTMGTSSSPTIDAKLLNNHSNGNLNQMGVLPLLTAYNARGISGNYDFAAAQAKVACIIGGHCHFDAVVFAGTDGTWTDGGTTISDGVYTGSGIPVIGVTCDKNMDEVNVPYTGRDTGTVNEQAFDVFTVDTIGKRIYTTRIGYGADRVIAYN